MHHLAHSTTLCTIYTLEHKFGAVYTVLKNNCYNFARQRARPLFLPDASYLRIFVLETRCLRGVASFCCGYVLDARDSVSRASFSTSHALC